MTAYLVIGVMRSGTSLISSILIKSGVSMGERFQDPHLTFQPNGFWEDLDFLEINEKILSHFGGTVGAGMLYNQRPTIKQVKEVSKQYQSEIVSLIKQRQAKHNRWGFKDPRLITTYPAYKDLLPDNLVIIWAYRKPESVLNSMRRTSIMKPKQAAQILETITWHCDKLAQTLSGAIQVDFDKLRRKDEYEVWRFADRLNIPEGNILECIK